MNLREASLKYLTINYTRWKEHQKILARIGCIYISPCHRQTNKRQLLTSRIPSWSLEFVTYSIQRKPVDCFPPSRYFWHSWNSPLPTSCNEGYKSRFKGSFQTCIRKSCINATINRGLCWFSRASGDTTVSVPACTSSNPCTSDNWSGEIALGEKSWSNRSIGRSYLSKFQQFVAPA